MEEFDIVFFTETHLNNQITDDDIAISGFDVPFRKDKHFRSNQVCLQAPGSIQCLQLTKANG
jgi:hypothetical protein